MPYLFQGFDFQGFKADRLKFTLEEIVKKHSDHVREIRWRASSPFDSNGNPTPRSEHLLRILESCPRLTNIDIDLDPNPFTPTENTKTSGPTRIPDSSDSTSSHDDQIRSFFIKPISQLTQLTHLTLTTPCWQQPASTESFLVDFLFNLSQLQGFSCTRIEAAHPKPLDDQQACQSPLGIHLASLTHLVELDLERADCLDSSWNQLDWKNSLKVLSLTNCNRVSQAFLNGFFKLFKSTLTTFIFVDLPLHNGTTYSPITPDDTFRFDLPRLANLEISSHSSIKFAKAFQNSKDLSWIWIGNHPLEYQQDLEDLIGKQLWPNLKKFELNNHTSSFQRQVAGLEALCQKYSIKLICHVDFYNDEDEISDDDFEIPTLQPYFDGYFHNGDGDFYEIW